MFNFDVGIVRSTCDHLGRKSRFCETFQLAIGYVTEGNVEITLLCLHTFYNDANTGYSRV